MKYVVTLMFAQLCMLVSQNAYADVKIDISFLQTEYVIVPRVEIRRNTRVTSLILTSDNRILTQSSVSGHLLHGESTFGVASYGSNFSGDKIVRRTSIQNGMIVLSTFNSSYSIVTHIKTNGINNCTGTRNYKLLPSHKIFEDTDFKDHSYLAFSNIEADLVSCTITALP